MEWSCNQNKDIIKFGSIFDRTQAREVKLVNRDYIKDNLVMILRLWQTEIDKFDLFTITITIIMSMKYDILLL